MRLFHPHNFSKTVLLLTLIVVLFILGVSIFPSLVSAQGNFVPLTQIDTGLTSGGERLGFFGCSKAELEAGQCLSKYLSFLYTTGIAIAGLLAVFSIVRGGFTLLFTDSILGHMEGKAIILRALGGIIIVYSSYLLVNLINPQLGRDLDLTLKFDRVIKKEIPLALVTHTDIKNDATKAINAVDAAIAKAKTEGATDKAGLLLMAQNQTRTARDAYDNGIQDLMQRRDWNEAEKKLSVIAQNVQPIINLERAGETEESGELYAATRRMYDDLQREIALVKGGCRYLHYDQPGTLPDIIVLTDPLGKKCK
ncbi:MAG: hypothetical protein Q7R88_01225 [bacterium]|nr:hypothetical protein [bacterium]